MIKIKLKKHIYLFLSGFLLYLILGRVYAETEKNVTPPKVPFIHSLGMKKYHTHCASCHGQWGNGSDKGPPLMHPFYIPSHHGDEAFYRAALKGIFAHHWKFGDMPPVPGITKEDMDKIIPFIRWMQQDKGLF